MTRGGRSRSRRAHWQTAPVDLAVVTGLIGALAALIAAVAGLLTAAAALLVNR
ncbi:hypothetical protein [Micromonospora noduli]|uniref:Uncharacterized protein n=1 Tax=Micromonospora noduli TaxID=709876 RepID=A0A328N9K2_9ACTN|nr:hypothetical protein [Micromonospora noduli]RAO00794.1 hypothetical protein LAH08_03047 [Micromonospora noduli]